MKGTVSDECFRTLMVAELLARGYEAIEVVGVSGEVKRGTAIAEKDGQRFRVKVMIPDNLTTVRRPHFRITATEVVG